MRGIAIAVVAGVAIAVWSCTVNTKTDKLACTMQTDCSGGRVCESGFCVIDPNAKLDAAIDAKPIDAAVCPATCDSCDFPSGTCTITGHGSPVACPAGWHCNIECGTAGACGDITCSDALACTVTCATEGACGTITCAGANCTIGCTATGSGSGSTACGTVSCTSGACDLTCTGSGACQDLSCGTGKCTESCQGSGACGVTSCASSCACDVTCNPLLGECGPMTCPTHANRICRTGMNASEPCNSHVAPQCSTCP